MTTKEQLHRLVDPLPDSEVEEAAWLLERLAQRSHSLSTTEELGGNLLRALTIARTEVLRAYRESSLQTDRVNDDIVKGWIWHSGLGTRTCPACWAMHGTVHKLDERLGDHVRGRCTMIPITRSWEELGFEGIPDTRVQVEPGTELFKRRPEGQQRDILGQAAFEA